MPTVIHRLLKPRTPDDCPACRLASTPSSCAGPAPIPVRPWCEVKSRWGAPKRVKTEGYACPNRNCPYFGITDAQIHAAFLRWQAWPGRADPDLSRSCLLQHLQCATQHPAVSRENLFSSGRRGALGDFPKGSTLPPPSGSQGSRMPRLPPDFPRAGEHAHTLHERFFFHLQLPHLQLDELRTRLRCAKQVLWRLSGYRSPHQGCSGDMRSAPAPKPWPIGLSTRCDKVWPPLCIPLFTSDGLNLYFSALTAHFGQWIVVGCRRCNVRQWRVQAGLIYGQVKKSYRRRRLARVSQVMRLCTQDALRASLQTLGFSGRLNTAIIPRANLTVRHGVAALARRIWTTAQQSSCLLAHLKWWRAYYHGCRVLYFALRVALMQPGERGGNRLAQRYRPRTPAMAAGRTNRRWTTRKVLVCPLPLVSA